MKYKLNYSLPIILFCSIASISRACHIIGDFCIIAAFDDSSVSLNATGFVVYSGNPIFIGCNFMSQDEVTRIEWRLNGTDLDDLDDLNLERSITPTVDIKNSRLIAGRLKIENLPNKYVRTSIECRTLFSSGSSKTSNRITLVIQGLHSRLS